MWSHYANRHTGICVGFDVNSLKGQFKDRLFKDDSLHIDCKQVMYETTMPILKPGDIDDYELMVRVVTTKHSGWQYEEEYRLVCLDGTRRSFHIPRKAISQVTFGCDTSPEDRKEIINILDSRAIGAKLYLARCHDTEFSLVIDSFRNEPSYKS